MLQISHDLTLSMVFILILMFIMAGLIIALVYIYKKKPELRDYLISLGFGFGLTLITALAVSFKYEAGTGLARKFGWPHFIYILWPNGTKGLYLGPGLSYILGDIFFYAFLALLVIMIFKITDKRRR
ncbi:MAG: hypothetical protein WC752_01040 [Patescibacteria group bacterium]|jgi:hypothetical protein